MIENPPKVDIQLSRATIIKFLFFENPSKNLVFGLITRKMTYYYQEFTRKLPVLPGFDPKPGSGNYQQEAVASLVDNHKLRLGPRRRATVAAQT